MFKSRKKKTKSMKPRWLHIKKNEKTLQSSILKQHNIEDKIEKKNKKIELLEGEIKK